MITAIFSSALQAAMPIFYATLGEIYTEKSGHLNLGVEGMMIMGAVLGFITAHLTQNPVLALLGALLAGALGAGIYAFLTITLKANQEVTGLALTIFGTGFASFFGKNFVGQKVPETVKTFFEVIEIPFLSKIPFLGEVFFKQNILVYFSYFLVVFTLFYFFKTKWGLHLRAVGENPFAADAAGVPVQTYKYVHTILGGACVGLGGAYLSLITIPVWQEGVTGGRGWIAVALVIFASWNPTRALLGALFFGGLDILGFRLQGAGIQVSQYLIDLLPYVCTVLAILVSTKKQKLEEKAPKALAQPFFREER